MRIALGIEYAGDKFSGWQIQHGVPTVQACVESALSIVANHPVTVNCAGRTDRGVHALMQVIHADVNVERTMRSWIFGGNTNLPNEISILWAQAVDDQFHARFSAQKRYYRYLILNRYTRPAVSSHKITWVYKALDVDLMQMAGQYLLGTHDFSSYRAVACQAKSPIRTVTDLTVRRQQDKIIIDIAANGFLHHMVRNIVGILITIGSGEQAPIWAKTVLDARDRTQGGVTAPAHGLYFCGVDYPSSYQFPKAIID